MGEDEFEVIIHYGGSIVKEGDDYKYVGEIGCRLELWKVETVNWNTFEDFLMFDVKICTPLGLLWFKDPAKEMKSLHYVFHNTDEDMLELISMGKSVGAVEVFTEADNPTFLLTSSQREDRDTDEEETVGGGLGGMEEEECNDDAEVDRPKEDEEGLHSEDENPQEDDSAEQNQIHGNADVGDDVILDAGDGGGDDRFKSLFEEGTRSTLEKEYNREQDAAEGEDEESEEDVGVGDEEYPDTPLSSEEELEELRGRTKRKSTFHGDYDKEPYIWLFQKFNSSLEFKDQLLRYSLKTQYDVKMAKSEANRIAVICCGENCPWRVYCSFEAPINRWMVKVCRIKHNHGKSSRVSMLKQGVIAGLFREELRMNVNLQASDIKDAIKARYDIVVPLSKCYRGRRIALDSILEAQTTQFGKLWDYEAELRRSHSGITTELAVTDENMFDCFYICFEELRNTWKSCCRPVIGLDGCFLKWELNGDVLAAVGRDADNRMYPIAWAIVRGENKDTWGWFVRRLKVDLALGDGDNLTIISDKQKGLVTAVEVELPRAEHRMCARHIYANWRKLGFTRSEYKILFWRVAYSYTDGEYEENMKQVEKYDPNAYQALLETEPHRWCRTFFRIESHCSDVHNNLSESFNRTIKMARSKPVLNLLEDIRRQAMSRISRRYVKASRCNSIVSPITMKLLEKARIEKKYCSTLRSSSSLFEVVESSIGYTVNLSTHQCACRKWDLTGIPCKHAVCVLDDNKDDPVKYVSECYYTHVLKATYSENIKPVNGEKLWRKTNKAPMSIPEVRKPRGRPKNRDRIKEPFESLQNAGKATRHGRIPHCSQCGQAGHIKRSCKNEPVVFEGPKNRRGRPRKHPAKSISQPKPRRARNIAVTGTGSQPEETGESSSQMPFVCSAPQPSVSSSQPRPHVKKPSRGRPLKMRKTGNIPSGVGTFWSPFTDRPFEVFGDRIYDRAAPQPSQPSQPPEPPEPPQTSQPLQ